MKRSELFFGALLVPVDFLAMIGAGMAAYWLRLNPTVQAVRPAIFQVDLPLVEYVQILIGVSLVIIVIFAVLGLYVMQATRRIWEEWTKIFAGISIGIMLIIVYTFLRAELFQSRFILLVAYGIALVFVTLARDMVRRVQRALLERGFGIHRVVLAGNGRYGEMLETLFTKNPRLGYQVVGMPAVVQWDKLEEIYSQSGIDEVIQTDPGLPEEDNMVLLDFCDKYKIDYKYVPNLFETYAARVQFRELGGVPLMELQRTPLDGWGRVAKRVMDIFGAVFGLIVLGPIMLAAAAAVRSDSPGPILYSQKRVGKNKREFEVYKFRSMRIECCTGDKFGGQKADSFEKELHKKNERTGPLFKMRDDPRITRVGRFIRKWRIDELPQFFNVLRGEMSLLGPRPHLPREVEQYEKYHQKLFTIKPGMSGMAQVQGNAGLSFEEEARLDIAYVEGWSLKLDVILLLKTFRILLSDKNAV